LKLSKIGFWLNRGLGFCVLEPFHPVGRVSRFGVGRPFALGLDAEPQRAFLGLLWPNLKNLRSNLVALISVIFTLALVPFVPSGMPVTVGAPLAVFAIYGLAKLKVVNV
jgi:predicted branched-subunit amino acid permease